MDPAPPFRLFGTAHLAAIGLTAALPLLLWAALRQPGREGARKAVRYGLAALLLANWLGYEALRAADGQFTPAGALPMQLCDWAMFTLIAALLTCRPRLYEVAYFWAMSGTLQAVLTPNLQAGFPNLHFIVFFVAHSGTVAGVLYLTAVERLRPRPGSLVRAMFWSEVYFAAALTVNALAGANYGFLSHRPPGRSLLDCLSPDHPLYLLELNLLALAFYLVLYLPFWLRDVTIASKPPAAAARDSLSPPSRE